MKTCLTRIVPPALSGVLLLALAGEVSAAPPGSPGGGRPLSQPVVSPKQKGRPFPGTGHASFPGFQSRWGSLHDRPLHSHMGRGHIAPSFHGMGGIGSLFAPSPDREPPWSFGREEQRFQPGELTDPLLYDPRLPLRKRYDPLLALIHGGEPRAESMLDHFMPPAAVMQYIRNPSSIDFGGRVQLSGSAASGQGRSPGLPFSGAYNMAGLPHPYRMTPDLDPIAMERALLHGGHGLGGLGIDPVLSMFTRRPMSPLGDSGRPGRLTRAYMGLPGSPFSPDPYGIPYSGRFPRPVSRAPSPPPAPSREEQRTAFGKLSKALVTVESLAKKEAWAVLSSGLAEQKGLAGLPAPLAEALRNIHAEAKVLDGLTQLRAGITSVWMSAPDFAVLETHLEAVRSATGDSELTGHVRRLLAVKAAWEGHDEVARLLLPGASAPDIDAELMALRESLAAPGRSGAGALVVSVKYVPTVSDEEREITCLRLTRKILVGIDEHLDSGRYSASVQLKGIGPWRTTFEALVKNLEGEAAPKKDPRESLDSTLEAVTKTLGRTLTKTDALVVRRMHAAGKSVEEITQVLR